ncbi:hypothetical protein BpHYR1_049664 [Brachionus plicatilis]|uniref:Uncharacterized protein n=1 Tax=Brachionus plicatilis TaxID=10195 RepID=A0A3M7R5W9_BRAPC|nr:hypothetical protein BpHYR1_049664 [Brachionus plicatilis]
MQAIGLNPIGNTSKNYYTNKNNLDYFAFLNLLDKNSTSRNLQVHHFHSQNDEEDGDYSIKMILSRRWKILDHIPYSLCVPSFLRLRVSL